MNIAPMPRTAPKLQPPPLPKRRALTVVPSPKPKLAKVGGECDLAETTKVDAVPAEILAMARSEGLEPRPSRPTPPRPAAKTSRPPPPLPTAASPAPVPELIPVRVRVLGPTPTPTPTPTPISEAEAEAEADLAIVGAFRPRAIVVARTVWFFVALATLAAYAWARETLPRAKLLASFARARLRVEWSRAGVRARASNHPGQ